MNGARGFGLVELMIAIALGTFVAVAALSTWARSARDYRTNGSVQQLAQSARYAADVLEFEIRAAGYYGLAPEAAAIAGRLADPRASAAALTVGGCAPALALDLDRPLLAADGDYALSSGLPAGCAPGPAGRARAGADTLSVRRARFEPGAAETGRLQLASTATRGALFADGRPPLVGAGAAVHAFEAALYYVAEDSSAGRGVPSLRRKRLVGGARGPQFQDEELVVGVADLQVEFGIDGPDADETPDRWVRPDDCPADASPRLVRIWLLVRAEDPDPSWRDETPWRYADRVVPPSGDHHRRLVVARTVFVRNLRRS